jgi:hypothetical protein
VLDLCAGQWRSRPPAVRLPERSLDLFPLEGLFRGEAAAF